MFIIYLTTFLSLLVGVLTLLAWLMQHRGRQAEAARAKQVGHGHAPVYLCLGGWGLGAPAPCVILIHHQHANLLSNLLSLPPHVRE